MKDGANAGVCRLRRKVTDAGLLPTGQASLYSRVARETDDVGGDPAMRLTLPRRFNDSLGVACDYQLFIGGNDEHADLAGLI